MCVWGAEWWIRFKVNWTATLYGYSFNSHKKTNNNNDDDDDDDYDDETVQRKVSLLGNVLLVRELWQSWTHPYRSILLDGVSLDRLKFNWETQLRRLFSVMWMGYPRVKQLPDQRTERHKKEDPNETFEEDSFTLVFPPPPPIRSRKEHTEPSINTHTFKYTLIHISLCFCKQILGSHVPASGRRKKFFIFFSILFFLLKMKNFVINTFYINNIVCSE